MNYNPLSPAVQDNPYKLALDVRNDMWSIMLQISPNAVKMRPRKESL